MLGFVLGARDTELIAQGRQSEKPQGVKSCGRGKPRAPERIGRHLMQWGCRGGFLEEVMSELN